MLKSKIAHHANITTSPLIPHILLLGGITEAYELAEKLSCLPLRITTSLAGRTKQPRLPKGEIRIGGFGGVDGLIQYCKTEKIDFIIDATHPFAFQMTKNAFQACQATKIPLIRFERPLWQKQADDEWIEVKTLEEAAQKLGHFQTAFLALGRQHLDAFLKPSHCKLIARMIELPIVKTQNINIILAKPGTLENEKEFLIKNEIDVIVCRNSGGERSYAKLIAARALKIPVIMISRQPLQNLKITDNQDDLIKTIRLSFNL